MTIEQAKSLCDIADTGSFTKAADLACLSQPALTQQMQSLEAEFACNLFDTVGRQKILNNYGKIVLSHARHIVGTLKHLDHSMQQHKRAESGVLTIAGGDSVLRHLLGPSLFTFHSHYPGIQLRLQNRTSAEALALVEDQKADLAIFTLPLTSTRANIHVWRNFSWLALREQGNPIQALEEEDCLIVLEQGTKMRAVVDFYFFQQNTKPRTILEAASVDQQLDFARAGFGTALVPDYAVKNPYKETKMLKEFGEAKLGIACTQPTSNPSANLFFELLMQKSDSSLI